MNDSDCMEVRPTGHKNFCAPLSIFVSTFIDLKPFGIAGLEVGTISVARRHESRDRTQVRGRPLW